MLPINLNEQNYAEINNEIFKLTFVVFFNPKRDKSYLTHQ